MLGQASQQRLHLVAFEEVRLGGCCPLHGDGRHLLADAEHLRFPPGDVVEQGVQGRQTLVAGADMIVAVVLQVAEEAEDLLEAQVLEAELRDLRSLLFGDEAQQEPDGVAVAAYRRRPQPFHRDQVVEEEGVDQRPERPRPGHGFAGDHAGSAKASNRRLASASSWGVMVR